MKLIQTFGHRFEAEQFASFLAGSGIKSFIKADDEAGLMPALSFQLGVKVYVNDEDFKRAMLLMNSFPAE
ncbi:MAG: DUF2007 domain-containing protein [Pseudobacteriovorax sp.]|nr:DUF2007 domain-containing protein [Pseudobacteriovorax sp.]